MHVWLPLPRPARHGEGAQSGSEKLRGGLQEALVGAVDLIADLGAVRKEFLELVIDNLVGDEYVPEGNTLRGDAAGDPDE